MKPRIPPRPAPCIRSSRCRLCAANPVPPIWLFRDPQGLLALYQVNCWDKASTVEYQMCRQNDSSKANTSYFHEQISMPGILNKSRAFVRSEIQFLECLYPYRIKLFWVAVALISATDVGKYTIALALLLRLVVPLVVWNFLAHKFWQTKISIDAVEKFLRMQEGLGPKRYAYTDITAITSYFRDKLGQGGYGSMYKGVLLPGRVHVAILMLEGNSNCTQELLILSTKLLILVSPNCTQEATVLCHIDDSYHLSSELTAISEEDE